MGQADPQIGAGMITGYLPRGLFRLSGLLNVERGKWYVGFMCPKCASKIYAFESPSQSGLPSISGEGCFSIPCRVCKDDNLVFKVEDLKVFTADEDLTLAGPAGRKPSNRPRQPLSTRYPKAHPTFGPAFLRVRPECIAIMGRCIALWSYVESALALLLASLLKIAYDPAAAIFYNIQNSRLQHQVLRAAAESVLISRDLEMLDAILNILSSYEKERNDLAHGLVGGSMQVEDGIIWTSQKDYVNRVVGGIKGAFEPGDISSIRNASFVYEPEDLESIALRLEWLHEFIGLMRGILQLKMKTGVLSGMWNFVPNPGWLES